MAKNYVQAGTTLAITATAAVKSGDLVQAGDVFVVAVTDIAAGATGDGIAHGVFLV
ncbi:capsid cement protein, partial [Salmonella enterica]